MITAFNTWIQGIVVAIIIATILEMIIPEGKNKKYIKTVIGIYILFTILSPILSSVSSKENPLEVYTKEILEESNTIQSKQEREDLSKTNEDTIRKLYEENLKKDIQSKLREKGYQTNSIALTIIGEEYKIEKIEVALEKVGKEPEESKKTEKQNTGEISPIKGISEVEEVSIQIGNTQKEEKLEETNKEKASLPSKEIEELKEFLSNVYQVNKQNIIIS